MFVHDNSHYEKITNELIENLAKAATMMDLMFEKFYKNFGLTRVQFFALFLIESVGDEGMPLSVLGEEMSVSRPNITTLIDRMEKRGLVKRVVDEYDRRSTKVYVTDSGKNILKKVQPKKERFVKEVFSFLNEKELTRANEILQKVQKELQEINIEDSM